MYKSILKNKLINNQQVLSTAGSPSQAIESERARGEEEIDEKKRGAAQRD